MHFFRYHGLSIPKIDGAAYRHFTLRITRLQFISLTMWNDLTSKLVVSDASSIQFKAGLKM